MSRQQLVPLNAYASASAPSTPTIVTGDLYYNTSTGLMAYNGSAWVSTSQSVDSDQNILANQIFG